MQAKIIKKIFPTIIVFTGLLFAVSVSFGLYAYKAQKNHESTGSAIGAEQTHEIPTEVQPTADPRPATTAIITPSPTSLKITKSVKNSPVPQQPELSPSPKSTEDSPKESPSTTTKDSQVNPIPNPSTSPSNNSSPTPQPQKFHISVSVDSNGSFSMEMEDGKNQCDVLSQALSEGKITSLNMKYNSTFGSSAIYQINGLGQEGQVWWTYSVNDRNPPLGCDHIKVQNNDNVKWTYIGPR